MLIESQGRLSGLPRPLSMSGIGLVIRGVRHRWNWARGPRKPHPPSRGMTFWPSALDRWIMISRLLLVLRAPVGMTPHPQLEKETSDVEH